MSKESYNLNPYLKLAREYRVAVLIATYKRPEKLKILLDSLLQQVNKIYADPSRMLTIHVIVAENDGFKKEGAVVVESMIDRFDCEMTCLFEPNKGVSIIRNTLTENALAWGCDFILFIDDDERASEHWIENMVETVDSYTADIVSGPVIPAYEVTPYDWIVQGGYFDDAKYSTGDEPDIKRTSNLLIRSSWLSDTEGFSSKRWFDVGLGRFGGEDSMLLEILLNRGARHVWCDEAEVTESIPENRVTRAYLRMRAYRFGNVGMLYRSKLRPSVFSSLLRLGKTSYLCLRWAILSGRFVSGEARRNLHIIEWHTLLGRMHAHLGRYEQQY